MDPKTKKDLDKRFAPSVASASLSDSIKQGTHLRQNISVLDDLGIE